MKIKKAKINYSLISAILLVGVAILFIGLFIIGNHFYQEHKNQTLNSSEPLQENTSIQESSPTEIKEKCRELGYPQGTIYVGSKNSDKFYSCTCHYANRIHSENIICFKTKQQAFEQDYKYIDCS